jgi:hypothetical protein
VSLRSLARVYHCSTSMVGAALAPVDRCAETIIMKL